MLDQVMHYCTIALAVVGAASVFCKAIAPLTSTKLDDEAATWLDKIATLMSSIALNPRK